MLLPFAERAFVNDRKLLHYCLDAEHPVGKHKARVFKSALNIDGRTFGVLKQALLNAVKTNEAIFSGLNSEGNLYAVDFEMTHQGRQATVRSAWIVKFEESFPRLVTCYVKPE